MKATQQKWHRHVSEWQQSGLTSREYAERAGVNARTLSWWKWNLGTLEIPLIDDVEDERSLEFTEVGALVPVSGPSDEGLVRTTVVVEPAQAALTLSVGDYELCIGSHFEGDTLHRLLDVLEARR